MRRGRAIVAGWERATDFRQPLTATVIVSLSDNGWFMPDSKHIFSENGYRTRISIYDPRTATSVAPWRAADAVPLPSNERPELAHSTDLLPTILGLALDTPGVQQCPVSANGAVAAATCALPARCGECAFAAAAATLCGHDLQAFRPASATC
jgi:hypothetical protein